MNKRLEQYLTEVDKWLRWLPQARRQDDITEMRSHMETALAATIAGQGGDATTQDALQDAAAREIIRQFGPARRVAFQLAFAHGRGIVLQQRGSFAASLIAALVVYKISHIALMVAQIHFGYSAFTGYNGLVLGCLISMAIGCIGAAFAPRKAVEAAVGCYLLEMLTPELIFSLNPLIEYLAKGEPQLTLIYLPLSMLTGLFYVSGAAFGKRLMSPQTPKVRA